MFGLTNSEGNHVEDVKELYYYLDGTPSHSYLKMLYKYPQAAFPYSQLVEENRRRGPEPTEFELLDTGLFDDDRYFDVFVEYAKGAPDEVLMQITAHNRGPDPAPLTLLPQLCCRNIWSWRPDVAKPAPRNMAARAVAVRWSSSTIRTCWSSRTGRLEEDSGLVLTWVTNTSAAKASGV